MTDFPDKLPSVEAKIMGVIIGIVAILVAIGKLKPDLQADVINLTTTIVHAAIMIVGFVWAAIQWFKKPTIPAAQGVRTYQDWLDRLKEKKTTVLSLVSIVVLVLAWFKLVPADNNLLDLAGMTWDQIIIILTSIPPLFGLFYRDKETILG